MGVSGVILAAGASSRLGRPKQLLRLDGEPVIHVVARNALASKLAEVILVTGGAADEVEAAVADLPVGIVRNADYQLGQSTSLIAGLRAVASSSAGALFLLGDQPEVDSGVIDELVDRFVDRRAGIVQPVYGDTPSNPVLFARPLFHELLALAGDEGARGVLVKHRAEIERVTVSQDEPPGDLDTEEDYVAMQARWALRKTQES